MSLNKNFFMIDYNDKIIFFSNRYRRQYFLPYKKKFKSVSFNILGVLFKKDKLIISDFPNIIILQLLKIFRKKLNVFLWNNVDELIEKINSDHSYKKFLFNTNVIFLFAFDVDNNLLPIIKKEYPQFSYQVLPPPIVYKKPLKTFTANRIIFYGELNIDNADIDPDDFNYLKDISIQVLEGNIDYSQIEDKINMRFNNSFYTFYLWKTRNLIRYNYLKFLANTYGNKLILIGDQLKIIKNATNIDSNYSLSFRKNIYNQYKGDIFIDLLCKSTSSCVYARSQELLENADVFIQLNTYNSKFVYKNKFKSLVFNSKHDLKYKIDKMLKY
jgi:hypothetical protein